VCLNAIGITRSGKLTVAASMADDGVSVFTRVEGDDGFYRRAQGGGELPCAPRQSRRGGVSAWPGYGGEWAAAFNGRWPMAARGRCGVAVVQAPRSTVQGTHTRHALGLGLGARSIGRRPASAFGYGRYGGGRRGADDAARARLTPFEFHLNLLEQEKLPILQLKCYPQSIPKL
jgi:hypothetical protein